MMTPAIEKGYEKLCVRGGSGSGGITNALAIVRSGLLAGYNNFSVGRDLSKGCCRRVSLRLPSSSSLSSLLLLG